MIRVRSDPETVTVTRLFKFIVLNVESDLDIEVEINETERLA